VEEEEAHHQWATKMWNRMDRDRSGSITRAELDCEEFRTVIRTALVGSREVEIGNAAGGGASYGRSQQNIQQAIGFLIRKSDTNHDGCLSFEEFRSFTRCLRQKQSAKHTAHLIFALFDVDGDRHIDEEEFGEIYRYFVGYKPSRQAFQAEWAGLDLSGRGHISIDDYVRWLQNNKNPAFKQYAPPLRGDCPEDWPGEQSSSTPNLLSGASGSSSPASPAIGPGMIRRRKRDISHLDRPEWNERFADKHRAVRNMERPRALREYFSRPQSLPELSRFYDTHRGFVPMRTRLDCTTPRRKTSPLSTETQPVLNPERHRPTGKMLNNEKEAVQWADLWQEPAWRTLRYKPGSLDLSLLPPPGWMTEKPGSLNLRAQPPEENPFRVALLAKRAAAG